MSSSRDQSYWIPWEKGKKGHLGRMEYLAEELQLVSPDDSSTEEKKNEKGRKGKNNYFSASNLSSK